MTLFIGFVFVAVAIGVVVLVRSGERELQMDEKDRKLAEKMEPVLDKILPPSEKPPQAEEESWTQDSIEGPMGDADGH